VRVSRRRPLRKFADAHADAERPLDDWYRTAKRLWWANLMDVPKTYPHADAVSGFTIFNIGGNKYPLAGLHQLSNRKGLYSQCDHARRIQQGDWKKR
jgi:mRNA-degrading endonuclease HigB of HigAB toxin-antitoxin module